RHAVRDRPRGRVLGLESIDHRLDQGAVERGLQCDVVVDELAAHLRPDERVDRLEEVVLEARQETAVDDGGGLAGDDVRLVAGLQLGRVGRVAERRADEPHQRAEFGSAGTDEATLVAVPPYHIAAVANLLTNLYAGLARIEPQDAPEGRMR